MPRWDSGRLRLSCKQQFLGSNPSLGSHGGHLPKNPPSFIVNGQGFGDKNIQSLQENYFNITAYEYSTGWWDASG